MKATRGNRGTAPLILNLGAKWRWMVNIRLRPLYSQARTAAHIDLQLDKQERQCTNNVHKITTVVENCITYLCVRARSYAGALVCVYVTLLTQHAKRMRRIILSYVTSLAPPYFRHYLIHGTIFGKKVTEHKMCVFIFSTNFTWNISDSRKIQRDIVTNVKTSSCNIPVMLVRF